MARQKVVAASPLESLRAREEEAKTQHATDVEASERARLKRKADGKPVLKNPCIVCKEGDKREGEVNHGDGWLCRSHGVEDKQARFNAAGEASRGARAEEAAKLEEEMKAAKS